MKYSIVIPVHNEEKNLPILVDELSRVVSKLGKEVEVIFTDDCSDDSSYNILKKLREKYKWIKIIKFKERKGQTAAFDAGFRKAAGEVIITMDGDLQNNPEDIFKLLEHYPLFDVIIGKRVNRKDSIIKKISSKIANYIRNKITEENIEDTGCSLKVFKAEYVKKLKLFNGLHRFLPTLCKMEGAKVIEVPVSHRPRRYGRTHYGVLNRAFKALIDALSVRWMKKRFLNYEIEEIIE